MNLEIKHLAGYLPYGLKIKYRVIGKHSSHKKDVLAGRHLDSIGIYQYLKPILHPLSDLRKVWKEMTNEEQNIVMHFGDMNEKNLWQEPFFIIEILFKYHFDIYGLIENGLAIDINTLEK